MKLPAGFLILIVVLCLGGPVMAAAAGCRMERDDPASPGLFVRHVSSDCSKAERTIQAVPAAEILEAMKAGKGISIRNAVVTGDLLLTRLPAVPLRSIPLPERVLSRLSQGRLPDVRVIQGALSIQEST